MPLNSLSSCAYADQKQTLPIALTKSRPIGFNVNFAKLTKDVKAALFLSQLMYWTRRGARVVENDGWIFKTREDWQQEIGLTRHEQASVRQTLVSMGLIAEARTGAPARNCYRIEMAALSSHLSNMSPTRTTVQLSLADIRAESVDPFVKSLLGKQFAYYKVLADITGTCTAAIYLSRALAISKRFNGATEEELAWDTEWFHMDAETTRAETGLTMAQQRDAKAKLIALGIIDEAILTHPRKKLYARVNMEAVGRVLVAGIPATGGGYPEFCVNGCEISSVAFCPRTEY